MHDLVLILSTAIASSGFWGIIQYFIDRRSIFRKALLGVMHYQILHLCKKYLERGSVHQNEYDDLLLYLYEPYKALGGNGTVEQAMKLVYNLPFSEDKRIEKEQRKEKKHDFKSRLRHF